MTRDKRTVLLGVVAAAAVAAAVSVTVFGHSSGSNPQRRAVTSYIDQVNSIEGAMGRPLTRVELAYRHFTKGDVAQRSVAATELAAAAVTLHRLGRRLAAVAAPPEAQPLRRRLLALVAEQTAITQEVQGMASFSPRFSRILARARVANLSLGRALSAIPIPHAHPLRGTKRSVLAAQRAYQAKADAAAAAQAAAVETYDAAAKTVLTQLAQLRPPRVFRPAYAAQVRAFNAIRAAGARLAVALRKTNRGDVVTLGRNFQTAARIAQSIGAQRAEVDAIKAYNARAHAVATAAASVNAELTRLQRTLP